MRAAFVTMFAGAFACAFTEPVAARDAAKLKERIIYSFCSQRDCSDGSGPDSSLIHLKGNLYGTTVDGGAKGDGTVFSIDPKTGTETVLHAFCDLQGCKDGSVPSSGLTVINGKLYGTTAEGGDYVYYGTLFSLNRNTGKTKTLHSFGNGADVGSPISTLIQLNGMLYGTTNGNGTPGTVFSLDPKTRAEAVVHAFTGTDGQIPDGDLINVNGVLFGTAVEGGANSSGTVFALDPNTGEATAIYSFCSQQNCLDGAFPYAGVTYVNGLLYGATYGGGIHSDGTIFSLNPATGEEKMLYSFCGQKNCTDGMRPEASLLGASGMLYGTASEGGSNNAGVVFAIDTATGAEKTLYSFCSQQNCADGEYPNAGLIAVKGLLYGVTSSGGAFGHGAVFAIKP